ncbi:MAG: hypothetical protein Q7J69_01795 [Candidatus Omnitrophota bacterium]|nr:hypothetical protein [Candidatus Omnitrophota bacterium]
MKRSFRGSARYPKHRKNADPTKVHLEKFKHLHVELIRYRDLIWKVTGFSWAMYYAMIYLITTQFGDSNSNGQLQVYFPRKVFFILMFIIAALASYFYLFLEAARLEREERYQYLGRALELAAAWREHSSRDSHKQIRLFLSILVFGGIIWTPVIVLRFFAKQPPITPVGDKSLSEGSPTSNLTAR